MAILTGVRWYLIIVLICTIFFNFIGVQLFYNSVLVSGIQQSDSVIHTHTHTHTHTHGLPNWHSGEEPACQWRRCEFDPWVGKIPWKRKWQPFQYFCWDNPMDRGASQATVHGVTKNQTRFSDSTAANLKTLFLCIVSPRGCKKSDTTAWLMHFTLSLFHKFIVLCSNVCLQVWLPLGFSFQFSEPHSPPHMHTK